MKKLLCFTLFLIGSFFVSNVDSVNYTVVPDDNNPSLSNGSAMPYSGAESILVFMRNMFATKGYTTLVGPCKSFNNGVYSDTQLDFSTTRLIGKTLGYYQPNGGFYSTLASSAKQKCLVENLSKGVYKINQQAVGKALSTGVFFGRLLKSRLLVQEFYFGQLVVMGYPLSQGITAFTSSDNKIISGFVNAWRSALQQTRYIRNAIEPAANSSNFKIGLGKNFRPIDFFVGAIVINKSNAVITSGKLGIHPQAVGFLPIASGNYMNNWTNVTSNSSDGIPTRSPISLSELEKTGGPLDIADSIDNATVTIDFAGSIYKAKEASNSDDSSQKAIKYFSKDLMTKFFEDTSPWAVVIEISSEPSITGIVKMSPVDFGQYLNIDAKVANLGSNDFTLADVLNAPFNTYQSTYLKTKSGTNTRLLSTAYPVGNWVGQGLANGVLEASIKSLGNINQKSVPLGVAHKYPNNNQILGAMSGIDWLFLRSLRVSMALLSIYGISQKLLDSVSGNKKSLFLQAYNNPNKNIFSDIEQTQILYVRGSSQPKKRKYPYLPILKVITSSSSPTRSTPSRPTPTRSTPSRPTPTRPTPTRPTPTRPTPTRPTPKNISNMTSSQAYKSGYKAGKEASKTSRSSGNKGLGSLNQSKQGSNASVKAYKSGYKAGQAAAKTSRSSGNKGLGSLNQSKQGSNASVKAYKSGYKAGQAAAKTANSFGNKGLGSMNQSKQGSNASVKAYKSGYKAGQAAAKTSNSFGTQSSQNNFGN